MYFRKLKILRIITNINVAVLSFLVLLKGYVVSWQVSVLQMNSPGEGL